MTSQEISAGKLATFSVQVATLTSRTFLVEYAGGGRKDVAIMETEARETERKPGPGVPAGCTYTILTATPDKVPASTLPLLLSPGLKGSLQPHQDLLGLGPGRVILKRPHVMLVCGQSLSPRGSGKTPRCAPIPKDPVPSRPQALRLQLLFSSSRALHSPDPWSPFFSVTSTPVTEEEPARSLSTCTCCSVSLDAPPSPDPL
ncbi:uncharacterized protein LOC123596739 [Leopardus geoffroyi]|uniref:uncharacterized protein LOC123596739 n=1 Tax=Leopardus geoffroyi TaxID=46844 RepID=UPI001E25F36B|nr:uncharacterized protein LOC123596739 [Leopardus geoffroyi]